ncbi:MAG: hypothetical protein GEV10_26765 [Streptosporangiales bacterium]|nr:hypothetical protein [Streptosporangiales bacterium]
MRVVSADGEHVVPVAELYTGPFATVLVPGELVAEIAIPRHDDAPRRTTRSRGGRPTRRSLAWRSLRGSTATRSPTPASAWWVSPTGAVRSRRWRRPRCAAIRSRPTGSPRPRRRRWERALRDVEQDRERARA